MTLGESQTVPITAVLTKEQGWRWQVNLPSGKEIVFRASWASHHLLRLRILPHLKIDPTMQGILSILAGQSSPDAKEGFPVVNAYGFGSIRMSYVPEYPGAWTVILDILPEPLKSEEQNKVVDYFRRILSDPSPLVNVTVAVYVRPIS